MNYLLFEKLCKDKGTTPTAISKKLGLSKGNTSNWKNGGNPSVDILCRLADELNCTTDDLLGRDNNEKYSPINFQNSNIGNVGAVGHNISGTINIGTDDVSYENSFKTKHIDETASISADNDEMADELLRIFKGLPLKERTKIMSTVYEIEDECSKKK